MRGVCVRILGEGWGLIQAGGWGHNCRGPTEVLGLIAGIVRRGWIWEPVGGSTMGIPTVKQCERLNDHACTLAHPDSINQDWSRFFTPSRPALTLQSLWSAYTLFFLGDIVQMYLANFSGIAVAIVYLVRVRAFVMAAVAQVLPSLCIFSNRWNACVHIGGEWTPTCTRPFSLSCAVCHHHYTPRPSSCTLPSPGGGELA